MSDWRVRKRYGFGAGQVRLAPSNVNMVTQSASPFSGLCQVGSEWIDGGLSQSLRRAGLTAGTLGLGALLVLALLAGFEADRQEPTDLRIVELVLPEHPQLAPAVAGAAEVSVAAVEPSRPVQKMPDPTPAPAVPRPEVPQLAALDLPETTSSVLPEASMTRPEPVRESPRPPVQIAAVERPVQENRHVTARASRVVSEMPRATPRPPVGVDPVAQHIEPRAPRVVPTRASPAARPSLASTAGRAPARVAPVSLAVSTSLGSESGRYDATPRVTRGDVHPGRATPRSSRPAALAAASYTGLSRPGVEFELAGSSGRTGRAEPAFGEVANAGIDEQLESVPLSSLAACMSDQEEDALKLDVLEEVSRPTECVSPAGRYRFVETKNLNAFLMWIERSPQRKEVDRCVELRHALDCVRNGGQYGGST